MKRFWLWAAAVFVILLAAPVAHASAAELHVHRQVASAVSASSAATRPLAVAPAADAAVPGGWTDDDNVAVAGIGVLLALGTSAIAARTASIRRSEKREAATVASEESRQREELILNTIDEIVVTVETYLLLRKSGQTADKSEVGSVLSGLTRLHRLADRFSITTEEESDFRGIVTAALTRDLDNPEERSSIMVRIDGHLKEVPPNAVFLSDYIRALADKLGKAVTAKSQVSANTSLEAAGSRQPALAVGPPGAIQPPGRP